MGLSRIRDWFRLDGVGKGVFCEFPTFDIPRRSIIIIPDANSTERINIVTNFEQAFGDTERAAESALKSAGVVARHGRALMRAAKAGNIAAVKRSQADLDEAMKALRQEVDNANSVWPFQEEDEERYLRDDYAGELIAAAREIGLSIYEQDDALISYPSVVRILPGDRAVRIDRKLERGVRPSHLADALLKNQNKTSGFRPNQFLESLYNVYSDIVSESESGANKDMIAGSARTLRLARIYSLLTALPGSRRDYGRYDFARDLYTIDSEGPRVTRRGHRVSFPASTGTRRPRASDVFDFIAPDGQRVTYYGIRFSEDGG